MSGEVEERKTDSILCLSFLQVQKVLLNSELAGGLAGLAPAGIKLGHKGVETLVVTGLQQVT